MSSSVDPKIIEALPPSLLNTMAAGQAPPGIASNFAHPVSLVPAILGVGTAFLVLALVLFGVRMYQKAFVERKWTWDDVLCSLGFAFAIVLYAGVVLRPLHNPNHRSTRARPRKLTLFIQYYSLFWVLRWVRISVWIGAILSGVFYTTAGIVIIVLASPWPGENMLEDMLSWHYAEVAKFTIPIGVVGVLVDVYLLVLPIRVVLGLQMAVAKKVGIAVMFMTGALACAASIANLYYRATMPTKDLSQVVWRSSYVEIFIMIEVFAGIACSSMPIAYKFFSSTPNTFSPLPSSLVSNLSRHFKSSTRSRGASEKISSEKTSEEKLRGPSDTSSSDREGRTTSRAQAYAMPDYYLDELREGAPGRTGRPVLETEDSFDKYIRRFQEVSVESEEMGRGGGGGGGGARVAGW